MSTARSKWLCMLEGQPAVVVVAVAVAVVVVVAMATVSTELKQL